MAKYFALFHFSCIAPQVFCVHGGIPSPENEGGGYIEAINKIPVPLPDPEAESPVAWEILWSDPIRSIIKIFTTFILNIAVLHIIVIHDSMHY